MDNTTWECSECGETFTAEEWFYGHDCEVVSEYDGEPWEDNTWADANALASAGWGTDEDYGYFGGDYDF